MGHSLQPMTWSPPKASISKHCWWEIKFQCTDGQGSGCRVHFQTTPPPLSACLHLTLARLPQRAICTSPTLPTAPPTLLATTIPRGRLQSAVEMLLPSFPRGISSTTTTAWVDTDPPSHGVKELSLAQLLSVGLHALAHLTPMLSHLPTQLLSLICPGLTVKSHLSPLLLGFY